jgi:hypothetical protein
MQRRKFIVLLGGSAVAWPLAARAQQSKVPVIGLLATRGRDDDPHLLAAFRRSLNEVGYVEGQNVTLEYRFAENQYDRLLHNAWSSPRSMKHKNSSGLSAVVVLPSSIHFSGPEFRTKFC